MTDQQDTVLSQEKFDELAKELEQLKTVRRAEIAKNLEYARSLGDLSENAEYQEARELQAATEERIRTEINRLIDEGWPETDCYGNSASGKRATLRQRIEKSLHATELSRIASDAIRQALNSSLGKDIEAAKAQIGQFIDAQVAGTLQAALKQALGLK
jgi:hypothetical protein